MPLSRSPDHLDKELQFSGRLLHLKPGELLFVKFRLLLLAEQESHKVWKETSASKQKATVESDAFFQVPNILPVLASGFPAVISESLLWVLLLIPAWQELLSGGSLDVASAGNASWPSPFFYAVRSSGGSLRHYQKISLKISFLYLFNA